VSNSGGYVEARTACINRLRGLLSELGIVPPLKAATVRRSAKVLIVMRIS
jgi:transposase